MHSKYSSLLAPIRIGTMEVRNRVALAPMGTRLGNTDDTLSHRMIGFYRRIAEGGTGLVITGVAAVSRDGTMAPGMNSIHDDRYTAGFATLAEAVHAQGARLAVHLMHGGMEAYPFYTRSKRLVSPSGGTFAPNVMRFKGMELSRTCMPSTPMTAEDIAAVGDDFAAAAARARQAGADAVEINGAQGFLLQQFYSPHFNAREDEYGGDFEGRMRFPLEVVSKVRAAVGDDFPIIFRMVATEGEGGGLCVSDACRIARRLEQARVDALHVTAGRGVSPAVWSLMMPIAEDGHAPIAEQVAQVKAAVGLPVIGVQRIVDPQSAEEILAAGKADMVALGRGLIADPDWVKKAAEGRADDIRRCIGCLQGCIGTQMTAGFANCLQNPEAGREERMRLRPAVHGKRVLVVGGGPAGLEAALVAGLRGHDVTLCEKEPTLGGQWRWASVPPGKEDYAWVVDWRERQIGKLPNVRVRLGCEVTVGTVRELAPDVALVATGSLPAVPPIPGANSGRVTTAHHVLSGAVSAGGKVAVIGGGATGCETANYLASQGKRVTLIEALQDVGMGEEPPRKVWLIRRLNEGGVHIRTGTRVERIDDAGQIVVSREDHTESLGPFDTIVLAAGVRSYDPLSERIGDLVAEVHAIGDAYAVPTNGLDAIHHAAEVARRI